MLTLRRCVMLAAILLLPVTLSCPGDKQRPPSAGIALVDAEGAPLREVQTGASVQVSLAGLRPAEPYTIVLSDTGGALVSWARLTSDAVGAIAPFVLWYHTGIVGCTRGTEQLRGPHWFQSFEEAGRALAGRALRLEVRDRRQQVVATDSLPLASAPRLPVLHAGNQAGCFLSSVAEGKEDVYAVGRDFPAGSIVEVYLVPAQTRWPLRAPLRDIRGRNRTRAVLTVRLGANETGFVARLWTAAETRVGSYDLIARHYLEGQDRAEWDFLEAGDVVAFDATSGFVVQEIWGVDPHLTEEIAGRRLSSYPYFEHVNGFAKGQDVWGAIDPKKKPASNPYTYAAWYVVDHKTTWNDGDALVDVTGGAEVTPIQPGCINGTVTRLWAAAAPGAVGPGTPSKAYDVVIDFGNFTPGSPVTANGVYTIDVDFIDRAETEGFFIIDDPTALGAFPVGSVDLDQGCNYTLNTTVSWTNDFVTTPVTVTLLDPKSTHEPCNNSADPLYNPTYAARMLARIKYPKAPGPSTAVASGGPFPLVLFLHGQQGFGVAGWTGYDYVLELLASHGFIAMSIDGNDYLDATIVARGELIREYLRRMRARNAAGAPAIGGVSFVGTLDLSKVVIVGHSRGGEAVVAASELQRVAPDVGYTIGGVVAISPIQGVGHWISPPDPSIIMRLKNVPYLVMHGAKDGDVSDFAGMRTYDRAGPFETPGTTPRQMVFIRDANHDFFNSSWITAGGLSLCTCDRVPNPLLPAQQQAAAKIYIRAFVEAYVHNKREYLHYFTSVIPPSVAPPIEVVTSYHPPAADRFPIDHHEETNQVLRSATANTMGGTVTPTSLDVPAAGPFPGVTFNEYQLRDGVPAAGLRISSDPAAGGDATGTIATSFPHSTHGAVAGWNASGDTYSTVIPASCTVGGTTFADCRAQAANYTHLSFRVTQVYRAGGGPNPVGLPQDFTVSVSDSDGDASYPIPLSYYTKLPYPWEAELTSGPSGPKSVMRTVRIPLAAFTVNSSQVNLNKLQTITFRFTRTTTGEIALDDIELVK
jgi:hypothetical protein